MPLFGRRPRPPVVAPPPAPVLGDRPCSEAGCAAVTGLACSYVDRRGRPCETAWCPQHRAEAGGRTYCRRHAGVARALEQSETPSVPDVGSRAASLATWVAADIDDRVVALLERFREPDEELRVEQPRLVFVGRLRSRAWEKAWKLTRYTGLGHWVAVQVPEETDDVVALLVDGIHVHREVPPWITSRREGRALAPAEDARAREHYYDQLLAAIEEQLLKPRST
jgi:hypothetical protein